MTPRNRFALTVAAALVAGGLITGCGTVYPRPDITANEAVVRVAELADEAMKQLPPGATLRETLHADDMKCDDGPGDDRVFIETHYQIDYPQGWPVDDAVPTLADFWTGKAYETVRDERDDPQLPNFAVEAPDGFRISIDVTKRDNGTVDAYLNSSSPCL
ncbi:hypothetical protein OHA21_32295 [Actinoplanes sp. NBC_00393]|uniref:hypothetical protein n=1 Tax=Actinoplanes sp. NBC_00393 TaxID=2975953 RepID=UPI002E1B470C